TSTNGGITAVAWFKEDGSEGTGNQLKGSNSYHVLTMGGTATVSVGGPYTANDADARFTLIEGVSITGGRANGVHYLDTYGGGLYCNGSDGAICSPAIRHVDFFGNAARSG